MREILFRGKRTSSGEWEYGDLWKHPYGKPDICIANPIDGNGCMGGRTVDPETVGQFTGLIDKNGKKIFEGDIVRCQFHLGKKLISAIASVVFKYGSFWVEWSWGYITDFYAFDGMRRMECEVLGNVYDNPELLEVET